MSGVTNNPIPAKGGSLIGATTINWEDVYKGPNVMWRVPRNIRWNDNIVVRQDETAVFYRDGKVLAYLDRPDRYALTSLNAPILGNLVQSLSGVRQEAEVYYLQRRIFDWKVREHRTVRLPRRGFRPRPAPRLRFVPLAGRGAGQFHQPIRRHVRGGHDPRRRGPAARPDGPAGLQHPRQTQGPGDAGHRPRDPADDHRTGRPRGGTQHFGPLGVVVQQIQGLSINLPDDVQAAVDTRSKMGVLGVNYMQDQAGQALTTAAANPGSAGSLAGAGVGLGAGLGMGYGMVGGMQGAFQGGTMVVCPKCNAQVPAGTKFCPSCGNLMAPPPGAAAGAPCPKCGQPVPAGVKFCPNCGASTAPPAPQTCPKCGKSVTTTGKFCPECGAPLSP